jgi:hypothetical protein
VLTIDGTVGLGRRELRNRGLINWGTSPESPGDILVSNGGTIINDGGTFEVVTNRSILEEDPTVPAGKFIVANGGTFRKAITEFVGTTVIEMPFENNGGTLDLNTLGVINFRTGFLQTAGMSSFGVGTYQVEGQFNQRGGNTSVGTGTLTADGGILVNGSLRLGGGELGGNSVVVDGSFSGFGTIERNMAISGGMVSVENGDLTVRQFIQNAGSTRLNGHTLTANLVAVALSSIQVLGGTLSLDGGILSDLGLGVFVGQDGTLTGPGTIMGSLINEGTVNFGGSPGSALDVSRDYTQRGSGKLNLRIDSPPADGRFDKVRVAGRASLSGILMVSLTGTYMPQSGDVYPVLTFNSLDPDANRFTTENLPPSMTASYGDQSVEVGVF